MEDPPPPTLFEAVGVVPPAAAVVVVVEEDICGKLGISEQKRDEWRGIWQKKKEG